MTAFRLPADRPGARQSAAQAFRLARLVALIEQRFAGNRSALARALGHFDGSRVRKMAVGLAPVSERTVAHIESLPGLAGWFAPDADAQGVPRVDVEPGDGLAPPLLVPVIGTTRSGPLRDLDWVEPWLLRDGDRYVEAAFPAAGDGRHAYALEVEGPLLSPRSRHGEYLVVTPRAQLVAGDEVVIGMGRGELEVSQLAASFETHVVLIDLVPVLRRRTRAVSDIGFMHAVGVQLPARAVRRHVDRPGYRGPDRRHKPMPVEVERRRG